MNTLLLIFFPAVAASFILLAKGERAKQAALVAALFELAYVIVTCTQFRADASSQFTFD